MAAAAVRQAAVIFAGGNCQHLVCCIAVHHTENTAARVRGALHRTVIGAVVQCSAVVFQTADDTAGSPSVYGAKVVAVLHVPISVCDLVPARDTGCAVTDNIFCHSSPIITTQNFSRGGVVADDAARAAVLAVIIGLHAPLLPRGTVNQLARGLVVAHNPAGMPLASFYCHYGRIVAGSPAGCLALCRGAIAELGFPRFSDTLQEAVIVPHHTAGMGDI